jgi:C1A family cysteine protease
MNSLIGIYKDKNCSQTIDTHALQLVGYGNTESGESYWIARNSWGLSIHYTLNK